RNPQSALRIAADPNETLLGESETPAAQAATFDDNLRHGLQVRAFTGETPADCSSPPGDDQFGGPTFARRRAPRALENPNTTRTNAGGSAGHASLFARLGRFSPGRQPAVHADRLTGDERGLFTREVEDRVGDVLRHAPSPHGDDRAIAVLHLLRVLLVPLDRDPARRDDVDRDPPRGELARH